MKDYLESTNVQLGASYNASKQSTELYGKGLEAAADFMGADLDEVGMWNNPSAFLYCHLDLTLPTINTLRRSPNRTLSPVSYPLNRKVLANQSLQ